MRITLLFTFILSIFHARAQHWAPLGMGVNNAVRVLFSDSANNLLYAGGNFTKANGIKASEIAVWNGTAWDSLGSGASTGSPVLTIAKFNNQIYSIGQFQHDSKDYLARWNGAKWDTITKAKNAYGIKSIGSYLYVYGGFDSIADVKASYIAKWDGTVWSAIDTTHWLNAGIADIISFQGDLYATGNFNNYNNTILQIAKWNGAQWLPVGSGFQGGIDWGNCFAIFNNNLYVGGIFKKTEGNPGNGIVRWDGSAFYDVGGGISCCGTSQIESMLSFNGGLYVAGSFTDMSGVPAKYFSKWDGTKWCGFGSIINNTTGSLVNYNGQLIIGGGFSSLDGDTL
ncbi:MAG TPA: hypothetical protein VNZ45_00735, partial [Bacteroidia bacterium]|nr:hypothetical protein [Bacteroidia bacterium]